MSSGEERGLLPRTAAGNRAYCACGEADTLFVFHSKDNCLSRILNKKVLLNMLGGLNCRHEEKKTIHLVSLFILGML